MLSNKTIDIYKEKEKYIHPDSSPLHRITLAELIYLSLHIKRSTNRMWEGRKISLYFDGVSVSFPLKWACRWTKSELNFVAKVRASFAAVRRWHLHSYMNVIFRKTLLVCSSWTSIQTIYYPGISIKKIILKSSR